MRASPRKRLGGGTSETFSYDPNDDGRWFQRKRGLDIQAGNDDCYEILIFFSLID
jgi:hypothetical protein